MTTWEPHPSRPRRLPVRMRATAADIDAALVPVIDALWAKGYTTRYCCQGDAGGEDWQQQAYIMFSTGVEAALFVAWAGPFAWSDRTHKTRHKERPAGTERWRWDWRLSGYSVHFPARDLARVADAVRHLPHSPLAERVGADTQDADPPRPAPRTCPTCGGLVMTRRKDARYCSRRCQQGARDRRRVAEPKGD